MLTQPDIQQIAVFINAPIEVAPLALNLDGGFGPQTRCDQRFAAMVSQCIAPLTWRDTPEALVLILSKVVALWAAQRCHSAARHGLTHGLITLGRCGCRADIPLAERKYLARL